MDKEVKYWVRYGLIMSAFCITVIAILPWAMKLGVWYANYVRSF